MKAQSKLIKIMIFVFSFILVSSLALGSSIIISSPANETTGTGTNGSFDVYFTPIFDENNGMLFCSILLSGQGRVEGEVLNNTENTFSISSINDGYNSYFISCYDGVNSFYSPTMTYYYNYTPVHYNITTCEELQNMEISRPDVYYTMQNDVDCSGITNWTPIGNVESYLWEGSFRGHFDGQNYKIMNLHINGSNGNANYGGLNGNWGLFRWVAYADIKNFILDSPVYENIGYESSFLFAYLYDSDVSNVHIINATAYLGCVGADGLYDSSCYGTNKFGGFAVELASNSFETHYITNSSIEANVYTSPAYDGVLGKYIGEFGESSGMFATSIGGQNGYVVVDRSYAKGNFISSINETDCNLYRLGGISLNYFSSFAVSLNGAIINNSYSEVNVNISECGTVMGSGFAYGISPTSNNEIPSFIDNSFWSGSINANNTTGIQDYPMFKYNQDSVIGENVYWNTNSSGWLTQSTEFFTGTGNATGLTTEDFSNLTLLGFDPAVWEIVDGMPVLKSGSEEEPAQTYSLSVSISSPTNETESNDQPIINYTTLSTFTSTINCSLYVNGTFDMIDEAVVNNTPSYFNPTLDLGLSTYYIECSDGNNTNTTATYSYTLTSGVNQAPVFTETNITVQFPSRSDFSLQINVTDLDNDTLTYSIGEFIEGEVDPTDYNNSLHTFNIDSSTGLLTRTARNGSQATAYKYSINVTDGTDMVSTWLFAEMSDVYADVNTYSELPNPSYRGNAIDYNLTCVDVDDDDIYYICQIYNGTEAYGSMVATLYANNSNVNICSLPSNTANKGETWKAKLGCSLWNDFFDTNEIWGNPNGTVNTTGITISNTAPVFTQSNFNYSMLDNESLSLQINATDVDNDTIQFTSNNPMFPIDLNSGIITNNSLISGNYTVQINITDGTEITSMEINFEIIYTNKPPVLVEALFEPNVAFRDTQLNFSLLCTDVDNENLTGFAQVYNGTEEYNGVISLPIFNNTLTMITYIPTLTTHKGEIWHADMWCSDDIFTTTIASTDNSTTLNSDPIPSITPTTNLSDNEIIHVDFNTTDLDQDTLNYSSDSPYFPIGYSTGIISNNHAPEGFYNVTFSVSDGTTTVYQWSTFYVTRNNYQPDTNTYTSTALNFSILCIDNNNVNITGYCQIYNNTETYDGLINLTVINNTLTPICDVEAGIVKKGETWYADRWCSDGVYNTSVYNGTGILILNSAPYFEQYDFTYFGLDNEIISLQINATDIDGDILQFESNDTLFPINSSTGIITTDLVSVGTYNVSINVTDGTDSDEMWVTFDIESGNSAPVLTVQFPTNNTKSLSSLSFNYSFIDNESSSLNCLLYIDGVNSENKTTDNNTLTAWTPTFSNGNHSYYVKCTDGTYDSTSGTNYYAYYYTEAPVITINSPANETKSGTALTINYTATNPNVNNLTCTVYRDGILNVTQTATNGTLKTASPTMNKGVYNYPYYVNCTDGLNVGLSETRTFLYSNYTNGTGTTNNPFLITNCTELQNMKDGLYSNYALANNIDCSETTTWNSGQGFMPIANNINQFDGCLNGQNFIISNLFINMTNNSYVGLFGYTTNSARLININLTNIFYTVTSPFENIGGLVAYADNSIIKNITITGNIQYIILSGSNTKSIGGISGYQGDISYSSFIGNISALNGVTTSTRQVGGISGKGYIISNSYFIGNINGKLNNTGGVNDRSGGIAGHSGTINNCWANITMINLNGTITAGIVGHSGNTSNSFSFGSISVGSKILPYRVWIGGIGAFTNSYAYNTHNAMTFSYSGDGVTKYDISDYNYNSTYNTFVQLQNQSLYTNWDFVNIWKWDTATNLPILRAEGDQSGYYPAGTVTLNSPANNTISSSSPVINFTVNSNWASTTNCTLYLNSVANQTIDDVNNNTLSSFTPTVSTGSYDYYISCVDGWNTMNTPTQNYIYFENNIPSVTATAYAPTTAYTNTELLFNATCEHNDLYSDGITAHCQLYNGTTAYNSEITKTVTNNTNTNICNVSANIVKKDETWKAQFFCSDNISSGTAVNSSSIAISNTAPVYAQSNFVYATLDNESINLQINATDLDNDALTYSINDTNFEIGSSSGIITKTTAIGEEYNVSVNVTDGNATTTMWVYFDIEVSNYAPELIGTDAQPTTAYKDTQLNFSVQCTEVDDEILNGECQLYNGTTAYGSVIETAVYNNTMGVVCSLPANTGNKGETWKAELWCNDGGMNSNKSNSSGITLLNTASSFTQKDFSESYQDNSNVNLQINATDIDGDTLTYYSTSETFPIDLNTGIIAYTGATSGDYNVTMSVYDGTENVSMWVMFNIYHVNIAPIVASTSITPTTAYHNDTLIFKATCTDAETTPLTAYCQIYNNTATYGSVSSQEVVNNTETTICTLSLNIAQRTETWKAEIICGDGTDNSTAVNTSSFTIENTAPLFITANFDYSALNNESISIQLDASDIDSDTLTYASNNSMFPVDANSGIITDNSISNGFYSVEYSVYDGNSYDYLTATFNITESNTAPTLTSTNAEPTLAYTNDRLNFSATCSDSESTIITAYCQIYNGTETYDNLSALNVTRDIETQVCYVPTNIVKKGETWKAEMYCSDSMFDSAKQNTSTITISNTAPTFTDSNFDSTFKNNESISIQLNATDIDADTLTYASNNSMFPVDSNSGIITDNSISNGFYTVEYSVYDGTAYDYLMATFNITESNTAPTLSSTNAQPTTAYTNDRLNFSVTCTDDQSSILTAYCQIYNGTATYDSLSSVNISKDIETQVCYVPLNTVNKGESWKAELSCSDGMFITESQNTSSITISNTAPTFTSPDFTHYMSNRDSISIQLNATDLDGDSLTYSTINTMFPISSSGLITNNSVAVGDYVVTYNVTDGTASDSLTVTYNVSLGNTAPTLTNVSSRPTTSYKDTELTFSVTCADITNASVVGYCQIYNDTIPFGSLDSLLVSVNIQTDVCVLPANTGNKDESWKAELWCGDGEFNSSSSYADSITLLNTAPVYTQSNFIVTHHTTEDLSLQINATDLDSDSLTYSINDTNFEIGSSSGLITRTGQASTTAGNYNVSVSINDGDTTVTMWVYFILTQTSPIIIITNPTNESIKTESFDISFTVTDSDTATTNCFAYLDSVSLANISSVVNNTPTTISTTFGVGNHNLYINCNDGIATSTSGVYSFYYDDTAVVINSFAPNIFNTTIFAGYTMTVSGNVTASELSLVSRTIYYPNSTVLFNEEQTVFGDSTFYNWSESYTTSDYPNGIYTMNIYAEDVYSHSNNKDITFEIGNCVPEWICNSYDTCGITDTQACDGVADSHTCGVVYTGDYSEFDDITCNYCSRDIVTANQTTCTLNLQTITYEDLNFATCCDVTGIGTDCYNDMVQNVSTYSVEQSCSQFTYEEDDIPKALWNTVVKFVLSFKSLI